MAVAVTLMQLEYILRSSKSKITREEQDVLSMYRAKAVRDLTVTACVASGIVWTALRKLGYRDRIFLSGGAALLSGLWRFDRSLSPCEDDILAMEGSRIQMELAKLILTKHRDDPWRMQLVKKHFYPEKVFYDSSLDRPISSWRHRNYFSDDVALDQRSIDTGTKDDNSKSELKQVTELRECTMSPAVEVTADPLDCVFGYSGTHEEIHHPDTTTEISPKRRIRSHKRAQRRHRTRHRSFK